MNDKCENCQYYTNGRCGTDGEKVAPNHLCYGYTRRENEMSDVRLIDANKLKEKLQARRDNGDDDFDKGYNIGLDTAVDFIENAPTVEQPTGEWNNHAVACLLADLFGDPCACNYCGIDEWLPKKCDLANKECPNVVGVACWEQFLKHRGEEE